MFTRSIVKKYLEDEKCWFEEREDGSIYSKIHPELKLANNMDEFIVSLNIHNHSHFKCIYSCPASLDVVLECQECGAIIFTGDDTDRYNQNLRCPVCSGEEQGVEYWTKEDIEINPIKQDTLKFYKTDIEIREKDYQRYKRTGLNSWELWKKEKRDKQGRLLKRTTLERMGMKGIRGLNLKVSFYVPEDDLGSVHKKTKVYPLSFYAWRVFRNIRKKEKERLEET